MYCEEFNDYDREDIELLDDIYTITTMQNIKNGQFTVDEYTTREDLEDMFFSPVITSDKSKAGAFIGGCCRKNASGSRETISRQILTLDADHPKKDFLKRLEAVLCYGDYATRTCYYWYTTASATKEQPRYRIIILLNQIIGNAELYRKICNTLMADIAPDDINVFAEEREFDWSSNEFNRVMFLPSKKHYDSYFESMYQLGEELDVNAVLDWREVMGGYEKYDTISGGTAKRMKKSGTAATDSKSFETVNYKDDPRLKDNIVGSFCKIYNIEKAIEKFELPYEECGSRWIYSKSESGIPGVTISDDGLFLYSRHESDPAYGRLRNAFDLVRIHLDLSDREMYNLAFNDPDVRPIETKRYVQYKKSHRK